MSIKNCLFIFLLTSIFSGKVTATIHQMTIAVKENGQKVYFLYDLHNDRNEYPEANERQLLKFIEVVKEIESSNQKKLRVLIEHASLSVLTGLDRKPNVLTHLLESIKKLELRNTFIENIDIRKRLGAILYISQTLFRCVNSEECITSLEVVRASKERYNCVLSEVTFNDIFEECDSIMTLLDTYKEQSKNLALQAEIEQKLYICSKRIRSIKIILEEEQSFDLNRTFLEWLRFCNTKRRLFELVDRELDKISDTLMDLSITARIDSLQQTSTIPIIVIAGSKHIQRALSIFIRTTPSLSITNIGMPCKLPCTPPEIIPLDEATFNFFK